MGLKGEVLELHCGAVEAHQVAGLAEKRGELVHDAALHAAVVVLGGLPDAGQLELVDAEVQQVVECKGESALQGCRRRHSRANRHIAVKHGVEAFELVTPLNDLAAHAENIVGPMLVRMVFLIHAKLAVLFLVDGVGANFVRPVELDDSMDALVDGAGENIAAVVVGVFANQVDAPRRSVDNALIVKALLENRF